MITLFIILGSICLIAVLIIAWWYINKATDNGSRIGILVYILIIGAFFFTAWGFIELGHQEAYKDALNGNNPYKKIYQCEKKDSTYVIIDSIYIKTPRL